VPLVSLSSTLSLRTLRLCVGISLVLISSGCSTQQAQQRPKPSPPPFEFLGEWGTRGDGPGLLKRPVAIATDFAGNVYIADAESRFVHKFNPEGRPLLSFKDPGLKGARSISVDLGGAIYVGATNSPFRIVIFFPDGSRLRTMSRLHAPPEAIVVDDEGNLFALCLSASLEKLNPKGRSLRFWRKRGDAPGELAYPSALTVAADGFLYVADTGNGRIQKFRRDLGFVSAWSVAKTGQQDFPAVVGLAAFKTSLFLLMLDQGYYRLEVRSFDGGLTLTDSLAGRLSASPKGLYRIATSPRGELFLLDSEGARVLRFRINF